MHRPTNKLMMMMMMMMMMLQMADGMEMMVISILGPAVHCDWMVPTVQEAFLTSVSIDVEMQGLVSVVCDLRSYVKQTRGSNSSAETVSPSKLLTHSVTNIAAILSRHVRCYLATYSSS